MRIRTSIKLIILGAVLLVTGLALGALSSLLSPGHLRALVLAGFGRSVNAMLEVRQVNLELPGTVRIASVSLTAPSGGPPVFECPRVIVDLNPASLLKGRALPRSLTLISPTLRLAYSDEKKEWNIESITGRGKGGAPAPGTLQQGVNLENATLAVSCTKLFGDSAWRTYSGLYVRLTPDSTGVWHFEGSSLRGPLAGMRFSGWFAPGHPARLSVAFSNDTMSVDEVRWRDIPYGASIWKDFQPAGPMSVSGQLSLDKNGELLHTVQVQLRDVTALAKYYPFPVHSVSGTVVVSNDGIVLKDITGVSRSADLGGSGDQPVNFRVSGTERLAHGDYLYAIQASDVPLTQKSIEAVPEVGPEVWQRLQPSSGTCQVDLTLSRPLRGAHDRFRARVDVRAATLHPGEIPLPLRQVNGTVIVDNDAVQLQNLSGVVPQDLPEGASTARFRVQGVDDLHGSESSLDVTLDNIHTTEALVKAIPHHGDAIWRTVQPKVALDAQLLVGDDADGHLSVQSALLNVHGGTGQLDFWPLPLYGLNGTLKLSGSDLLVEQVNGNLHLGNAWDQNLPASSQFTAHGTVDLKADSADVHVTGRDVVFCEELLRSIPVVGTKIWEEVRPAGVGTVDGQIVFDRSEKHPFHCFLDVGLQDVSMTPKALKTPLTAVAGHLLVTEKQAFSNEFSGLVCGGRFTGRAVLSYGPDEKYPRYGASASVEKADVARLAKYLTGSDQGIVGQVSGWVDMGGFYGQPSGMAINGYLSLTNGHLLNLPLFAQLLNVLRLKLPGQEKADQQGDVTFSRAGDRVNIQDFEFNGGGLNLTGTGSIGLDGSLNLTLIAVGAPKGGIPIISTVVDWLLSNIERQLVRVDVTGTLSKPEYSSTVLSTITWPLRSLRSLLFTPILGGSSAQKGK